MKDILINLLNSKNFKTYSSDDLVISSGRGSVTYLIPGFITNSNIDMYVGRGEFNKFLKNLGISHQEYYDLLVLGIADERLRPKCKCSKCNNTVTFRTIKQGYRTYCSISCGSLDRPQDIKDKLIKSRIGKKDSDETRRRKSLARKGFKWDDDIKIKISKSNTGKKRSLETRKKISENSKRQFSTLQSRIEDSKRMIEYCKNNPEFLDNLIKSGKYNSKKGYVKLNKYNNSEFYYMSSWEKDLLCILDNLDYVSEIDKSPRISYKFNGIDKIYVPDILVKLIDGTVVVIEVKPQHFLMDEKVVAKRLYASRYFRLIGYKYITITNHGIYDKNFSLYKYI